MSSLPSTTEVSVILLLAGTIALFSYVGSRILAKFNIPTASGFIISGMVIGNVILPRVQPDFAEQMRIFSDFALGLIGFEIGSKLNLANLKQRLPNLLPLLFIETVGTFGIVLVVMTLWFQNLALGILFGAISAATAPAVTLRVIWETKSEGPFTRTVYFLLAADDFAALVIASFAIEIGLQLWLGASNFNLLTAFSFILFEIAFSLVVGISLGVLLEFVARRETEEGDIIALVIGMILLIVGLTDFFQMSNGILTSMILGMTTENIKEGIDVELAEKIESITMPILVFFFILVGLEFDASFLFKDLDVPSLHQWQTFILLVASLYTLSRFLSKFYMARLGAQLGKNPPKIAKNIGLALQSQGGVALGIAFIVYERLILTGNIALGIFILDVLALSTIATEIIGVFTTRIALERAGEIKKKKSLKKLARQNNKTE